MSKKILVIDDDVAVRQSFLLAFKGTEFEINTATSGLEGIERHQKNSYDLIFLDLKMEELNGVDTLRQLRNSDPNVPIYIITAFHEEYFEQIKNAKADHIDFQVLRKPLGQDQILLVTKGVLKGAVAY